MAILEAEFNVNPKFRMGERVTASFILRNASDKTYTVLVRKTPLEKYGSRYITVTYCGEKIKYDSIVVKRGKPAKKEFISIAPKEAIMAEIDITDAYSLDKTGTYRLSADLDIAYFEQMPENSEDYEITKKENVVVKEAVFEIVSENGDKMSGKPVKTRGQKAREAEKLNKKDLNEFKLGIGICPPNIIGAINLEERKRIENAHYLMFQLLQSVLTNLGHIPEKENTHYEMVFGRYDKDNYAKVKEIYVEIKNVLEKEIFTYELLREGDEDYADTYAYTFYQARTIYLCELWHQSSLSGMDSNMGTILHELTHAVKDTDDIEYGREECRQLAKRNAKEAINNADSYEFFIESQTMYWGGYQKLPFLLSEVSSDFNPILCVYNDILFGIYKGERSNQLFYLSFYGMGWLVDTAINDALSDCGPAATVYKDKMVLAYKKAGDHDIQCKRFDKVRWENMGIVPNAKTETSPEIVVYKDKLYLIYVNEKKNLYYTTYDGTKWDENPTAISQRKISSPTAAILNDALYIICREESNGKLFYLKYTNASFIECEFGVVSDFKQPLKGCSPFVTTIGNTMIVTYVADDGSNEIRQIQFINCDGLKKELWTGNESIERNADISPKSTKPVSIATYHGTNYAIFQPSNKNCFWIMKQITV